MGRGAGGPGHRERDSKYLVVRELLDLSKEEFRARVPSAAGGEGVCIMGGDGKKRDRGMEEAWRVRYRMHSCMAIGTGWDRSTKNEFKWT